MEEMANTMPSQLKVNVTQQDLEIALQGDHRGCAIVCAIVRPHPNLLRVIVGKKRIAVSDPVARERYSWDTPDAVAEWLGEFDETPNPLDMGPLKFTLRKNDAFVSPTREVTAQERAARRAEAKQRQEAKLTETKAEAMQRRTQTALRNKRTRSGGL